MVLNEFKLNDLVNLIQEEMKYWYCLELTKKQVTEYVKESNIDCFDTVEREDYGKYIAREVTGMSWPMNGSSADYKKEFYSLFFKNCEEKGYKVIK